MSIRQTYAWYCVRKTLEFTTLKSVGLQLQIYCNLGKLKLEKGEGLMLFCSPPLPPPSPLNTSSSSQVYQICLDFY